MKKDIIGCFCALDIHCTQPNLYCTEQEQCNFPFPPFYTRTILHYRLNENRKRKFYLFKNIKIIGLR